MENFNQYISQKYFKRKVSTNMKIVVLDGYTENPGDLSWDALKELGDVLFMTELPTKSLR